MSLIPKSRLEAFSDGVIAIIITIMVLEIKAPHTGELSAIKDVVPAMLSYVLSFIYVGIYWNNHHHLLHAAKHINAQIMWSNLHLLFWLSLIPFASAWIGEYHRDAWPTALYGGVLFMSGFAYTILQHFIVLNHGRESPLAAALGQDFKGKLSVISYALAIALALKNLWWFADILYFLVAMMWVKPDRRIEKILD